MTLGSLPMYWCHHPIPFPSPPIRPLASQLWQIYLMPGFPQTSTILSWPTPLPSICCGDICLAPVSLSSLHPLIPSWPSIPLHGCCDEGRGKANLPIIQTRLNIAWVRGGLSTGYGCGATGGRQIHHSNTLAGCSITGDDRFTRALWRGIRRKCLEC